MGETKLRDIVIVGGGPAGMMAGFLFARAGLQVTVLEKHADFFRDFRGDTVHPSTMELLHELGMLERFLARPHDRLDHAEVRIAGRDYTVGDLSHLSVAAPFIAMMPQWEFLDFLRSEAAAFPGFRLRMETRADALVEEDGRIAGVRLAGGEELRARLTIMADGRDSLVRSQDLLPLESLGAPLAVLWFPLGKADPPGDALRGSVEPGRMVILIDRGTYWQTAFLVPKGGADAVRARGVAWVRAQVAAAFPDIRFPADGEPDSIDDLKLLVVSLDRLTRWHRPGLLAIGDAAHAMSPIGGIGINLAIQDAVAAANLLAGPMVSGADPDPLLNRVQKRRLFPTRVIQTGQKTLQDNVIGRVLSGRPIERAPWIVRLLDRFPLLRRIPGRVSGLGGRRERVRSPQAPQQR